MIGFTITAEQLRTAPPEVRDWIAKEVALALGTGCASREDQPPAPRPPESAPDACSANEAAALYQIISRDAQLTQAFFALGRSPAPAQADSLHALSFGRMLEDTGMEEQRLAECLVTLDGLFRRLRGDSQASLFVLDRLAHLFVQDATCRHIKAIWDRLAAPDTSAQEGLSTDPFRGTLSPCASARARIGLARLTDAGA